MGATSGIIQVGGYASTLSANIQELIDLLGDPDALTTESRAAGSNLDEMSPIARAQLAVELQALLDSTEIGGKAVAYGTYTAVAADATANLVNIVTGLADINLAASSVTIVRSGSILLSDQVISEPSAGTIRVADGSTYSVTAGDVINWMAVSA